MPKKVSLILTLIVILALVGGVWFWFAYIHTPASESPTTEESRGGFFSFFGNYFGGSGEPGTQTPTNETPEVLAPAFSFRERLTKERMLSLSDVPLSGTTFALMRKGTTTPALFDEQVRFVERETGHVVDLSITTGDTERISNTTIPGIQETIWGNGGNTVALRYLAEDSETIETFVGTLPTTTPVMNTDLVGTFFPQNITSLAMRPTNGEVFYVIKNQDGAAGRITNVAGTNTRTLFSSPLREWAALWTSPLITLTTKPSARATGSAHSLNPSTGALVRLTPNTSGLTVLMNTEQTRVLYTNTTPSTVSLFILNLTTQETWTVPLRTLPEKCVWRDETNLICAVPDNVPGNMPDIWYQGRVSLSDTLWAIDTETKLVDFLISPEEIIGEGVDAIGLSLSSDGTILSFINKKDLRGWIADVTSTNN
ncbi:MAG: hypothetical protein AAB460_01295 [Patescibacteria group bacterium]